MPALPAAKRTPIWRELAPSRSCANRTSCAQVVDMTKLIIAIISEMLRSTGCDSTYRRPARMSCKIVVAAFGLSLTALKLARIRESESAEIANDPASNAITQVSGKNEMSAPARSGPETCAAEYVAWIRPFAVTKSSVETRLGIEAN